MKLTKTFITKLQKDPVEVLKSLTDDEIGSIVDAANKSYYNDDKPLFSDDFFDLIKDALKKRDSKHAALGKVGAPIAEDDKRKETLPYFMGSLDKLKDASEKELSSFKKKYQESYVISDKLDGNSGLLYFHNNEIKLFTRGDGSVGQNITSVLKHISGIPNTVLLQKDQLTVRGEFIISKSNFEKIKTLGKNARNMAAGVLNAKKPNLQVLKYVEFVAYELISPKKKPSEQMEYMNSLGFEVVHHRLFNEKELSNEKLSDFLVDRRKNSPYEVDGIVIMHNKSHKRVNDGNPSYGFAFKSVHTMQRVEVIVTNVEWNLSKDGYLVPTVIFPGVNLAGVVIQRATGFNGKFINDNKIGPGSKITIIRSGDIIPYIQEILTPSELGAPMMPEVSYVWSKTGVDIMLTEENKKDNDDLKLKVLENFVKKIEVVGLGPGNVKKMFDAGFDTPKKLFAASAKDLLKVDGFKEKSATKIHEALQESKKKLNCLTLMDASNTMGRGLGQKKLELIIEAFPDILKTRYVPSVSELVALKGVESTTANMFITNLPAFFKFVDENDLTCLEKKKPVIMEAAVASGEAGPSKSSPPITFVGQKFVFTGFRNKELEAYLSARGGEIVGSVSKKTTMVIAKDVNEDSGKITKAKDLNIPIVQVDTFIKTHHIKL